MPEASYVFVYGTLRRATGTEWSRFLSNASRFVGEGRTHGALFQLNGYPGMSLRPDDAAWVCGEVYLLNDASSFLPVLDVYEGCGPSDPLPHAFERHLVDVVLDDGPTIAAWAYVYALETKGKPQIASGDYLQHAGIKSKQARDM